MAVELIYAAKQAGADAIKVQLFLPDQMTLNDGKTIISDDPWAGRTLYELYYETFLPFEWVPKLRKVAEEKGLVFFATVYHPDTVDDFPDMPIYKIASFEITYLTLIEKVAQTKKPVIISTGMADYAEIETAVKLVRKYHNDITLLRCVSDYPAEIEQMNLKTIPAMSNSFKLPVGLSDHTTGIVAAVVAAGLGAVVVEKHLTIDGKGLDGGFSIKPSRFKVMAETIRAAEASLGEVTYGGEKKYRRQLVEGRMVRV